MVLGRGKRTTSTAARVRPDGGDGASTSTSISTSISVSISVSANGIHYTAIDARSVRMPVEHPSIVAITVRTAKVDIVISSDKRILAVRENREK